MNIPTLKIEIEGVKAAVTRALITHNEELNSLIIKSLEDQLTEEWVVAQVNLVVKNMLSKAIEDLGSNWQLRNTISNLVAESVTQMIESKKGNQNGNDQN